MTNCDAGHVPVRVFISYSHDSSEHEDAVLSLSDRLRVEGVDAYVDLYEENPKEGWPRWMEAQIRSASYVLLICTEIYCRRVELNESPRKGLGAIWESGLIYNELYSGQGTNDKFIPVLLRESDRVHIPKPLQSAQWYVIDSDSGYNRLYRRLTNQPWVDIPPLGAVKALPRRDRKLPSQAQEQALDAEVVSAPLLCRNFPPAPVNEIQRDNVLSTIKTLGANMDVVVVEGPEGIGKTTALAQFARINQDATVSTFLADDDRASYDADILRANLAQQIGSLLNHTTIPQGPVDALDLRGYFDELRRFAKRQKHPFFFVIDGLGELSDVPGGADGILAQFPERGLDAFRFIVTGDLEDLRLSLGKAVRAKSFPLVELSLEDTLHLIGDVISDRDAVAKLHQLCRALPAAVASARRLIVSGYTSDRLLTELSRRDASPLAIEWNRRQRSDDNEQRLLAQLAYDDGQYTENRLAEVLNLPEPAVRAITSRLTFLTSGGEGRVRFHSNWFRRQARQELQQFRKGAHRRVVQQLLKRSETDSLIEIPRHMAEASDFSDVLSHLTPEHLIEVVHRTQNLSRVQDTLAAGLNAAKRMDRDADMLRFGIDRAVLADFLTSGVGITEVTALASLGQYEQAFAIARSAIPKEDRLHLFAIIAHKKAQRADPLEPELIEQIKVLAKEIEPAGMGARLIEICSELITVVPEVALDLAENIHPETANRTVVLARLSVIALESSQTGSASPIERLKERGLRDQVDLLQQAFSTVSGKWNYSDVIVNAEKLEKTRDRLFLFRSWTLWNKSADGTALVIEKALDLAITATDFSITATVLRELAEGLSAVTDREVQPLVGMFDAQRGSAQKLGPSLDYVRLQLLLAEAEARYDTTACEHRLLALFYDTLQIDDLAARAEAWAWFLGSVVAIVAAGRLSEEAVLVRDATRELEENFVKLLDGTASHLHAASGVITATARWNAQRALEFARMLNTEFRRDKALLDIVEVLVSMRLTSRSAQELSTVIEAFADADYRDEAVAQALHILSQRSDVAATTAREFLFLFDHARRISTVTRKVRALQGAYAIAYRSLGDEDLHKQLLKRLNQAWCAISTGWVRVNTGFSIAQALADISPDTALEFLHTSEALKRQLGGLSSKTAARVYCAALRLGLRAFSGLVTRQHDTAQDFSMLAAQIDMLPSPGERAALWTELALKVASHGDRDLCCEIFNERIRPAVASIPAEDASYVAEVKARSAPAAYISDPVGIDLWLDGLDAGFRDFALNNVIQYLFRHALPGEPDDYVSGIGYEMGYEQLASICNALQRTSADWLIYEATERIIDTLLARKNENRLKQGQKDDIYRRLSEIIDSHLPAPRHIRHNGYKIICRAQLNRYRTDAKSEELIAAARSIPNTADSALVLFTTGILASDIDRTRLEKLANECAELVAAIPSKFDKINRYTGFAAAAKLANPKISRQMLSLAAKAVPALEPGATDSIRRMIDVAYNISPAFAAELADKLDDDRAKRSAKRQLDLLEWEQKVIDEQAPPPARQSASPGEYQALGISLLSSLQAQRIDSIHITSTRPYIESAAKHPLYVSYFLFAWIIENAIDRHADTVRAGQYLRPIFEAALAAAELAYQLAEHTSKRERGVDRGGVSTVPQDATTHLDRHQFTDFLSGWVVEHGGEHVTIYDPGFGREDLQLIRLVQTANPRVRITVVTSRRSQDEIGAVADLEDAYRLYWRAHVSLQSPPSVRFVVLAGEPAGDSPFLRRAICGGNAGMFLSAPFRTFGTNQPDEIAWIDAAQVEALRMMIEDYASGRVTEHEGRRVRCSTFIL